MKVPVHFAWQKALEAARSAEARLRAHLPVTPLVEAPLLASVAGCPVYLKLETKQPTGSFKVRPAFNGILSQLEACRKDGVLTTSSGNYAQAVAFASQKLGVRAAIVMTDDTAPVKVELTKKWGAEVIFCGTTFESRFEKLEEERKKRGSVVLHGFDSEETIAGDGVISLEVFETLRDLRKISPDGRCEGLTIVSPASGGGLISGIARTLKALVKENSELTGAPDFFYEVWGAQPAAGGAIAKSLQAGKRVNVGKVYTVADALVASMPGVNTFQTITEFVDGFELVSEDEIKEAFRWVCRKMPEIGEVEPGGVVSIAAVLFGKIHPSSRRGQLVCVVSGANVSAEVKRQILSGS